MSRQAVLHVVGRPLTPTQERFVDPDKRLRALFRTEARLEGQLLDVRREIALERRRYAEKHRLGCFPSVDQLRRLFK